MRKRIASRLGIYPIIFYIFAVSATVLRTLALFFDYEPENGYFAAGSYFTTAAAAAIAAGAVLLLPLLHRREARFTERVERRTISSCSRSIAGVGRLKA